MVVVFQGNSMEKFAYVAQHRATRLLVLSPSEPWLFQFHICMPIKPVELGHNVKWLRKCKEGTREWHLEIMENNLYAAAVKDDINTLQELPEEDKYIVDKASMNPLHIAAMLGNVQFVKEVLEKNPNMCFAGDRFGRLPLHLAVIKGNLPVLEELIKVRPLTAREKTEGGGNVLHLCVKYNQLEALKIILRTIKDKDIANRKDDDGMTILHLAVCADQIETVEYLLMKQTVDVNAKTANGNTALDLCQGDNNKKIARALELAVAEGKKTLNDDNNWLSEKRATLMVVASLVAAMAFQAAVNPTMGVWEDDSNHSNAPPPHSAGEAVMAYKHQTAYAFFSDHLDAPPPHHAGEAVMAYQHKKAYPFFIRVNTVAFASSLSVIMLLISDLPFKHKFFMWVLTVTMWSTITSIALTYGISIFVLTPKHHGKELRRVTKIGIFVWCGVMSLLLWGSTIRLIIMGCNRVFGINVLEILRNRCINVLKILRSHWQSALGKKSLDNPPESSV